jgi:hypothetical protein
LPDSTPAGSVASSLAWPSGTQDFESVSLGDEVQAISNWQIDDESSPGVFTIRAVDDVLGDRAPRNGSLRWLRVRDGDDADVRNRLYGPAISAPEDPETYNWSWFVNLESTPPGTGLSTPRMIIQHLNGSFEDAWGIDSRDSGAFLIVTGTGGTATEQTNFILSRARQARDSGLKSISVSTSTMTGAEPRSIRVAHNSCRST